MKDETIHTMTMTAAEISHCTPHPRRLLYAAIISFALLLRISVGFHPHSGQDDYQGPNRQQATHEQRPKYGGDYEAQRHWMEITYHLPIREWYYHDLEYWGLDYPPLTAYFSYFFGWVAHSVGGMTMLHKDDDASFSGIDYGDYQDNKAELHQVINRLEVCDEGQSEVCISRSGRRKVSKGLGVLRDLVALHSSRWGFEHSGGKVYMRFTVLLCDLLIYMSAVWVLAKRLVASQVEESSTSNERDDAHSSARTPQHHGTSPHVWLLLTALCQPAIILIDHGHFQYNSVSLGLALWSFHYITIATNSTKSDDPNSSSLSFMGPIWGSVLFSLALNFKQMELYHAPAVFAYLLGRCFCRDDGTIYINHSMRMVVRRFTALGVTVVLTFSFLWLPFALSSQSNSASEKGFDVVKQILIRLFPFHRGVFEGKVANLWCALSIKPFSIRNHIPDSLLPVAALGLTLVLILPPCYLLFRVGRGDYVERKFDSNDDIDNPPFRSSKSQNPKDRDETDLRILLWGTASTSLAFFLASYQVHEKGILIPLAPMSLLMVDAPNFVFFFSILATWSLWPLLVIDRLREAYICCLVIFICMNCMARVPSPVLSQHENDIFSDKYITRYVLKLAIAGMIILHILETTMLPPSGLPDFYPVLWSFAGCGLFFISYLGTLHSMMKQCNRGRRCKVSQTRRRKVGSIPPISILGFSLLACATSEGFVLRSSSRHVGAPVLLSSGKDGSSDIITEDLLCRAQIPLEWERKRAQENLPVLNLSIRESDTMSSSVDIAKNSDELSDQGVDDWRDGNIWKITEQHLMDMGIIISHTETNKRSDLTSHQMLTRAPQLYRLPTSQVIDAAHFLLSYPSEKKSAVLIEVDPSLLTYLADDLHYGLCEYLPNMMFMGDSTIAAQTIETQLSRTPLFALQLIRMAVDGGIDERSVSRALGSAGKASGKAVEGIVGDLGRGLREWKQAKGGKGSLGK